MRNALKLTAALVLIAASATAASAQTYGPRAESQVYGVPGVDYGYPPYPRTPSHYATPTGAAPRVYENGKLIGQDPDANVRMMLQKDFSFQ